MSQTNGKCLIFSAPSGAGKTTVVRELLKRIPCMAFSISATSRAPRGKEKDGVDYYFLSPEEFRMRIDADEFLECEEVYKDNYYGTLRSEVERLWNEGKLVVFDVDVVGGLNIKKIFEENALSIFVMPPDLKTLESRLRGRGTETEEKIQMRLAKAEQELERSPEFDLVLVNDDLNTAVQKAEEVVNQFMEQ